MNKVYFLVLLIIFTITLKGQNKITTVTNSTGFISDIRISESQFNDFKKGKFTIRDYYESTDPSKPGTYKLPSENFLFVIPPYSKPKITIISKLENSLPNLIPKLNPSAYKKNDSTIILKDLKLKNYNQVQNRDVRSDIEIKKYFWYRDFYCVAIRINSHKFNPNENSIKALKDIKLKFTFSGNTSIKPFSSVKIKSNFDKNLKNIFANWQMAEQFRRAAPRLNMNDSTFSWINFGSQYLKIATADDGIYKLDKQIFSALGINSNIIDPRTFQLFSYGKEKELFVKGESDGSFDQNDYIEFWGQKNYNLNYRQINLPTEEYNEYTNRYTDTTYYFLTWGSEIGQRMVEQNNYNSLLADTLDYYLQTDHYEDNTMLQNLYSNEVENQMPNWNRNKSWYWSWLFTSPRNYNFTVSDLVPNHIGELYFKLVSGGSNISQDAHQLAMRLGQTIIDSQSINKQTQVVLQGNFNSDILTEGTNNINIHNYNNGSSPNFLAVDWYDVEYPRSLKFYGDSLIFLVPKDINSNEYIVQISNVVGSEYDIYKISPTFKKINNYLVNNNTLYFSDTLTAEDKYIIQKNNNITSPKSISLKVLNNILTDDSQADYIAITHNKFVSISKTYLDFIRNTFNVTTRLLDVQGIYDQFGFGYPTQASIKLFLQNEMEVLKPPKPTYLVFIGDASYDYKDYVFKHVGVKLSSNYVPSFGDPVGDNWYVIWDDAVPIPQMEIGRIPILNEAELNYFLSKIKNNIDKPFSEWNKRYLLFSGGNSSNSSELSILKKANDDIISNYIKPKPISGLYTHFYKTINPQSDFGPYSQDEINDKISKGGVFISYLGHSGTATWDNGVNATYQLTNTVEQNPFMTDYGCSTNKFAEPDIISFGERFLLNKDGQATGYIGNSSLGFLSTAISYPALFYNHLVNDFLHEVGSAHVKSKFELWQNFGGSSVAKVFEYTNCLLGDPIIRLKIPNLPNLLISNNDINISQNISEIQDSAILKIPIKNLGLAINDSISISILQFYNKVLIKQSNFTIPIPDYTDTLNFSMLTKNRPGIHTIRINIDPLNKINEIYKYDNTLEFQINVLNLSIRDLNNFKDENGLIKELKILNPTSYDKKNFNIKLQISNSPNFLNPQEFNIKSDSFYTKYSINFNQTNMRYWYKYSFENNSFTPSKSYTTLLNQKYAITDTFSSINLINKNISFSSQRFELKKDSIDFSILSAGALAGATCVISQNGKNLLPNSFFTGIGVVVVDSLSFNIDTVGVYYLFNRPDNVKSLSKFINSIPSGKIVLMGVSDDAKNNMSSDLRNSIKSLGSSKIDSLQFRGSWAL